MKLFDPEGSLMNVLGKLSDLIFINFMFVIFSLPILTMGAAVCAMYDCTVSLIEDTEDVFLPRQFVRSFRKNFKRGLIVGLLSFVCLLFFGLYYMTISSFTGVLFQSYRITLFVLIFLFLFGFQYVYPMITFTDKSVREVLASSWKLAVAALPYTVLNLLVIGGLSAVFLLLLPANTALFLWAFLFFALIAYMSSFVIRRVFDRFQIRRQIDRQKNCD